MNKRIFFGAALIVLTLCASYFLLKKAESPFQGLKDCPHCNVVFILIDTLRADHLSTYGYQQKTDPFISELAKNSTVFMRAFSSSSWTAPATASIFTSLYPSQHQVINGFQATAALLKAGQKIVLNQLPKTAPLLPEIMKASGFQTIGVADNINIGKEIGFVRGFEHFKTFRDIGAQAVNSQAEKYLDVLRNKGKYFLYLHYMDPHQPYKKRDPFYTECLKVIGNVKQKKNVCAYNSEIKFTDEYIAALAKKYEWAKNSIIIITADHGEEFLDHGQRGHGNTLYRELIHVPLIIYYPNGSGRKVYNNVHTIDLLPTLNAMADHKRLDFWEGRNLVPFLRGEEAWNDNRFILSERYRVKDRKKPEFRSLIQEDMHFIHTFKGPVPIRDELFNIKNDFRERRNIFDVSKPVGQQLSTELFSKFTFKPFDVGDNKTVITPDDKLLKELRSLGYFN